MVYKILFIFSNVHGRTIDIEKSERSTPPIQAVDKDSMLVSQLMPTLRSWNMGFDSPAQHRMHRSLEWCKLRVCSAIELN